MSNELDAVGELLNRLERIGTQMSNVCFNLGQENASNVLDERTKATMRRLRKEWDDTRSELRTVERVAHEKLELSIHADRVEARKTSNPSNTAK